MPLHSKAARGPVIAAVVAVVEVAVLAAAAVVVGSVAVADFRGVGEAAHAVARNTSRQEFAGKADDRRPGGRQAALQQPQSAMGSGARIVRPEQADLSLIADFPPNIGTFNYQDARTYTPEEAIDQLNHVLSTKGYTLVRRDRHCSRC